MHVTAVAFIVFLVLVCGVLMAINAWMEGYTPRWPRALAFSFRAVPLLVNEGEHKAFHLLQRTFLGAYAVCPKVRLEDIADAVGSDRFRLRGHTKSRHVDFLVIDAASSPVVVVEVDGGVHDTAKQREVDELKDRILTAAGVPVVRLRVGSEREWPAQLAEWAVAAQRAPRATALGR